MMYMACPVVAKALLSYIKFGALRRLLFWVCHACFLSVRLSVVLLLLLWL